MPPMHIEVKSPARQGSGRSEGSRERALRLCRAERAAERRPAEDRVHPEQRTHEPEQLLVEERRGCQTGIQHQRSVVGEQRTAGGVPAQGDELRSRRQELEQGRHVPDPDPPEQPQDVECFRLRK